MDIQRERHMRYMEVGMRGSAVIVLFLALCFFKVRNIPNVYTEDFCMRDKGHILTASMNEAVNKSPALLTFFQLSSSGLMDVVFLNMVFWFLFKGKTGHILQSLATFYVLRGVVQGNFMMAFPDGGIWDYPGFPSFVIPYGLARDFYFSGHCGFVGLNTAYMIDQGRKKTALLFIFIVPYVAYVLIMCRIHYTIDIPIGYMFGIYVYLMLRPHQHKIDRKVAKTTMAIKRWLCTK